jgi:hypothetical protein
MGRKRRRADLDQYRDEKEAAVFGTGWLTQHKDDEVNVQVKAGQEHRSGKATTEFVISPRDGSGDRQHVVIDDEGNELLNEWHEGRKK